MTERECAVHAAEEAAKVILSFHHQRATLQTTFKGPRDLVTNADVASEKVIISILQASFPDDFILAEEGHHATSVAKGRWWIIDPIDGTTNFAHGFPIFCVSIGLWIDGYPHLGVVLDVMSGECFVAEKGKGATCNGVPIRVSQTTDLTQSLIATGFPYHEFRRSEPYLNVFKHFLKEARSVRRPGAATYDLCSVAAGRFDGFYEFGLQAWDVGAAGLIVQEAGGVVTNWAGGDDWLFSNKVIAGNPAMQEAIQKVLETYIPTDVLLSPTMDGAS